jgi:hypothetical protein
VDSAAIDIIAVHLVCLHSRLLVDPKVSLSSLAKNNKFPETHGRFIFLCIDYSESYLPRILLDLFVGPSRVCFLFVHSNRPGLSFALIVRGIQKSEMWPWNHLFASATALHP